MSRVPRTLLIALGLDALAAALVVAGFVMSGTGYRCVTLSAGVLALIITIGIIPVGLLGAGVRAAGNARRTAATVWCGLGASGSVLLAGQALLFALATGFGCSDTRLVIGVFVLAAALLFGGAVFGTVTAFKLQRGG